MNSITITDLVPLGELKDVFCLNDFETSTGSQAGIGRFLVSYQLSNLQNMTSGITCKTLTITSDVTGSSAFVGSHSISIPIEVAGFQPIQPDINGKADIFEAICYDGRLTLDRTIIQKRYNCQYISSRGIPEFDESTLSAGNEWTFQDIINDIGVQSGLTITVVDALPNFKPRNFILDSVSCGTALSIIAAHCWMVIGYDHATGVIKLYNPGTVSTTNTSLITKYANALINFGGARQTTVRNPKASIKDIVVCYPLSYRAGLPNSIKTQNRFYSKTITVNSFGTGSRVLHLGNYLAYHDGTSITNSAELDAIAAIVAAKAWTAINQDIMSLCYGITIPFELDGSIRCIKWTGDKTFIQHNNELSSSPLAWINKNIEFITASTLQVLDGIVSGTPSGKHIIPPSYARGFWARITSATSLPNDVSPEEPRGINSRTQWEYEFEEVIKQRPKYTVPGFDAWLTFTGARTGKCYNTIEDINFLAMAGHGGPMGILGSGDKQYDPWSRYTDTFTDSHSQTVTCEAGDRITQILTVVPVITIVDGNLANVSVVGPDGTGAWGARNVHTDNQTPAQNWLYADLTAKRIVTADFEFGKLHPCSVNNIVWMTEVLFNDENTVGHPLTLEYLFSYENSAEMSINPRLDICVDVTPQPVEFAGIRYP